MEKKKEKKSGEQQLAQPPELQGLGKSAALDFISTLTVIVKTLAILNEYIKHTEYGYLHYLKEPRDVLSMFGWRHQLQEIEELALSRAAGIADAEFGVPIETFLEKFLESVKEENALTQPVPYKEYIKSNEWKRRANRRKKKDEFKCVMCGATENLQVHHLNYIHLGDESMDDLVTLCGNCHLSAHEAKKKIYLKYKEAKEGINHETHDE